jgi:alpha-galactosidase
VSTPTVHLRGGGVSVLLAPSPTGAPLLLHWGADLGDVGAESLAAYPSLRRPGVAHSSLDTPRHLPLVPDAVSGFTGAPAVEVLRGRRSTAWSPRWEGWTWDAGTPTADGGTVSWTAEDAETGLHLTATLELGPEGLLRTRLRLRNTAAEPVTVLAVRQVLPVPAEATELLDLTGRWTRERQPQRHAWPVGTWSRPARHGRTGHDATLLLAAGTPGFGFTHGEVHAVHVAWSGDHLTYAERTPEGECLLGGGELLAPGEVELAEGEDYTSPWLVGSCSTTGLDALSHRFHRWLRARSPRSRRPRPVVANSWEAVYFDHDLATLSRLADAAAGLGAERFVLDDGWFQGRRGDTAGLGDWAVDPEVWPEGLHPLADHLAELGLELGLWVEPEMVNEDSDLARKHPDWLLRGRTTLPAEWRSQQVLDLQVPAAYAHVRDALVALLEEYPIAYLKWDHNRDLVDVAHDGRPAVHGQTLALYRLLDELRERFPALEIETCASGGGRIDLGILERTDRVWPSDTLDPIERQVIQRWTGLLVPPELMGAHIGGPVAHTTGRTTDLSLRAATALIGHAGLEWDVTTLDETERRDVRAWLELHRQLRGLIATGDVVHPDHPDPALVATGVVSADRTEAVYVVVATGSTATQHPAPLRLAGLDPERDYLLRSVAPTRHPHRADLSSSWLDEDGVLVSGALLARAGVRLPVTTPEQSYVLHATTDPGPSSAPSPATTR